MQKNPIEAKKVFQTIEETIFLLKESPSLGRAGRISGTRELITPKTAYLIPYRIKNSQIEILRIFHSSRKLPKHW